MRTDMSVIFSKMDQAITVAQDREATKEMVPTKLVTWGVGLAISTLVAIVGVGLTTTGLAGGVILWAMTSGDTLQDIRSTDRHELVLAKLKTLEDDVVENRVLTENAAVVEAALERRIDLLEAGVQAGDYRLVELEKDTAVHTDINRQVAELSALMDNAASSAELEALRRRIDGLNDLLNSLRKQSTP